MYIRSVCAVLDFNANVNRPNKTVDGEVVYKLKVYNAQILLGKGS